MRIGIFDHFGWAVAVTASTDHEVVDRRRIELIEPGVTGTDPLRQQASRCRRNGRAWWYAQVRRCCGRPQRRSTSSLTRCRSRRVGRRCAWPPDFPGDIAVQRRTPYEARRRDHVSPGDLRSRPRPRLARTPLRGEGRSRASGRRPGGLMRSCSAPGDARSAVDEGPSSRARRSDREHRQRDAPAVVSRQACVPPTSP